MMQIKKNKFVRAFLVTDKIRNIESFLNYLLLIPIILLLILISWVNAQATTYYVSPSGRDNNKGSKSAPFRTIQHAAGSVNPGDTVIVGDGTYTGPDGGAIVELGRGGRSGAPITFKSANKWGAVLEGNNSAWYGFEFDGNVNYINIEGFQMRNIGYAAFVNNGSHCLYFYNNNVSNSEFEIIGGNNYNITFDSNVIHDTGYNFVENNAARHGLYIRNVNNYTAINNIFYNIAGFGVHLYGGSASNVNIVGNTFAFPSVAGKNGQIGIFEPVSGLYIADNIFYNPNNCAVIIRYVRLWQLKGFTIDNNLTTAKIIINCLDWGGNVRMLNGFKYSARNNLTNTDPMFTDPHEFNFHLRQGSPAIGAGIARSRRSFDADGNYMSNPRDIGANEYTATGK